MRLLLFIFLALWCISLAANANDIEGRPVILDGDTLRIGAEKIRFHGIDAPELDQACRNGTSEIACGLEARHILARIIDGRSISCEARTIDIYGRIIGKCYADGVDLQYNMVRAGWAVAYRRYSEDYVQAEEFARYEKRGIWQWSFLFPCQHRQMKRNKPITDCNWP